MDEHALAAELRSIRNCLRELEKAQTDNYTDLHCQILAQDQRIDELQTSSPKPHTRQRSNKMKALSHLIGHIRFFFALRKWRKLHRRKW